MPYQTVNIDHFSEQDGSSSTINVVGARAGTLAELGRTGRFGTLGPTRGPRTIAVREGPANVRGFIYCLATALPAMRERGGGRVVVAGVEDTGERRTP